MRDVAGGGREGERERVGWKKQTPGSSHTVVALRVWLVLFYFLSEWCCIVLHCVGLCFAASFGH